MVLYKYNDSYGGNDMKIPFYIHNNGDYLQNPILRRFVKDKGLKVEAERKEEYIKAIEKYASESKENEQIVYEWLMKCIKEGSKEVCYMPFTCGEDTLETKVMVEKIIKDNYSNCPKKNLLEYCNTRERTLVDYNIIEDKYGNVSKIEFIFSRKYLYGDVGKKGDETVFPLFVDLYVNEKMIVSRAKAKTTLFDYDDNEEVLLTNMKIITMSYAKNVMQEVGKMFSLDIISDVKVVKNKLEGMYYKIYKDKTYTPEDIEKKIKKFSDFNKQVVEKMLDEFDLDKRNFSKALEDFEVLEEKYISINDGSDKIFKENKKDYIIKIASQDYVERTKIDTESDPAVPLQSTEVFFDSKKSVENSKRIKKIHLNLCRENQKYFSNELVIQFGVYKNCGYFKTNQYAEECDIEYVLQTIFDYYRQIK